MRQTLSLQLTQTQELRLNERIKTWEKEALKAFKKVSIDGKNYCTCNVERLKQCNRLGDEKEITLYKTHFFLKSPGFDFIFGVIFNARPGIELAEFSKQSSRRIYLATGSRAIMDLQTGTRIELQMDLTFASDEE